jgi:hypothetical protein
MNTIKGNYADAVIYTDDIEEYAKAQIQLICDNEISRDTDIRVMPDVHPGKVGPIGLNSKIPRLFPLIMIIPGLDTSLLRWRLMRVFQIWRGQYCGFAGAC